MALRVLWVHLGLLVARVTQVLRVVRANRENWVLVVIRVSRVVPVILESWVPRVRDLAIRVLRAQLVLGETAMPSYPVWKMSASRPLCTFQNHFWLGILLVTVRTTTTHFAMAALLPLLRWW